MDGLIAGPDRPMSRRVLEQMRELEIQERRGRPQAGVAGQGAGGQEGYWAYMQRQVQERTERLGFMDEGMGRLEETSGGWADDVGKFVKKQKRQMVLGAVGGKLGF